MGVQLSLKDIQSGFLSATLFTQNNTLIEQALNKALDRTASTDNAMEVDLDMGTNRIYNTTTDTSDPTSLLSVADGDARYLNTVGDTLTGDINAGGFNITNMGVPTGPNDAARLADVGPDSAANLRTELSSSASSEGTDLIAHTGTTDTVTQALDKRTIYVGSVADLIAITSPVDKQLYNLTSYHGGWNVVVQRPKGGGEFAWDASRPKADHNGGTIIDPTRTYPTDWTDEAQKTTWFAVNATTGTGCYVRTKDVAWLSDYGGKVDDTTNDTISLQSAIDAEWKVIIDEGRTRYDGVSINKNNFAMEGVGYARSILVLNSGDFVGIGVADTVSTSGTILKDFMIQGQATNAGGITLGNGTFEVKVSKLQATSLFITGFSNTGIEKGFGIKFRSNQNTDIERVWIQNCTNAYHRTNEGYQTSTRIHGKDSYSGSCDRGFLIEGNCDDLVLDGVTIEGNQKQAIYATPNAVAGSRGVRLWVKNTYFEANCQDGVTSNVIDIQGGTLSKQEHKLSLQSCNFAANPNAPVGHNDIYMDRVFGRIVDSTLDLTKVETTATCFVRFDSNKYPNAADYLAAYRGLLGSISAVDFDFPNLSDDPNQINYQNSLMFPATPRMVADTNTIDAYEEGSYVPTVSGVSGTISAINGYYTLLGKTVTLRIVIQGTDIAVGTEGGGVLSAPTNVQEISSGTAFGVTPRGFLGGVYVTNSDDTLRLPAFTASSLVIVNATYEWSV